MITLYYSPTSLAHQTPSGHPESPARIQAIIEQLKQSTHPAIQEIDWQTPSAVELDWFAHAHSKDYIQQIAKLNPNNQILNLDGDTYFGDATLEAVKFSGGALKKAVDDSIAWIEQAQTQQPANTTPLPITFNLARPPGHHAENSTAMGFCIFSMVSNAAIYAHQQLPRVAIIDFDVHHGNGTEQTLNPYPDIFFASSYQEYIFPMGTQPKNADCRINAPMPARIEGKAFKALWQPIFEQLRTYQPQILFVCAGFDAHIDDPLADCCLVEKDFQWLGEQIITLAQELNSPIVVSLEGGYNLTALANSVEAFLLGLTV